MRIIHFSDFHLCPGNAGERSLDILDRMIDAINDIKKHHEIDMVVFSGDLVDKGGKDFGEPYSNVLNKFKNEVIAKVVDATDIPSYRFLFVGGNHEVERGLVNGDDHKEQVSLDNEKNLERYMSRDDIEQKMASMKTFMAFQKQYYEDAKCEDVEIESTQFQTTLKFEDNGDKVGVALLNTAWMCYDNNDEKNIAMGVRQLNQSWPKFTDCDVSFAIAHHHPSFLKDFDKNKIEEVLHEKFDVYFCGHTHNQKCKYVEEADGSIFESVAAGNLYNDLHETDEDYKNGFTVIDYDKDSGTVEVTPYTQHTSESFDIDYNYGNNHDGTWYFYKYDRNVFMKLDEWLKQEQKIPIIGNDVLENKREDLRTSGYTKIILTALSGLGKTRLIYDTFKDGSEHPNHFYASLNSTNIDSIRKDITKLIKSIGVNQGLIIIDNCTSEFYDEINGLFPDNVRLICSNNEYYDIKGTYGTHVVRIDTEDMRPSISAYIDENLPLNRDNFALCEQMKTIADGYPVMAYELIKKYHEEGIVNSESADSLMPKLLNFEAGKEKEQEAVMIMLALFQPFPMRKASKSAYEFIVNNEILCGVEGSFINKQKVINSTVNRFCPTTIEKTDRWINVRPFPLAVWLMGKWFEQMDEDLMEQLLESFEELKQKDNSAYKLLTDSLAKRVDYTKRNHLAYEIITRLNSGPDAPFANEKVVCSDMGSRLFLAMSVVNPVAVAQCLTKTLKGKNTEWLRENISYDVRRNLVWTLEKLCFCKDSFSQAAILMARLSLAENEGWSNNATGQFLQLFHILLPGTQASLDARLETIKALLSSGDEYISIAIKAINSAFTSSGFVRDGSVENFGDEKLTDYNPTNQEVWEYWYSCRDLLISIAKENHYIPEISKIIEDNSLHWIRDGYFDTLFKPLVEELNKYHNGLWTSLYKTLKRYTYKQTLLRYNKEKKAEITAYIEELRPKIFSMKLYDAQVEYWHQDSKNPDNTFEILENIFMPLVVEFVDVKVYSNPTEIRHVILEKDYVDMIFVKNVIKKLDDRELQILFDSIMVTVADEGDELSSSFLLKVCYESKDRSPLKVFLERLLNNGYKKLFVNLSSRCENENLDILLWLHDLDKQGTFEEDFLDIYLSCVGFDSTDMVIKLLSKVYELYPSRIKDVVACLLRIRYMVRADDPEEFIAFVKSLLLLYPIDDEQPRTNSEYSRFVIDILGKKNDEVFAKALNTKLIDSFNHNYLHGNFDGLYAALLINYGDAVWDDFVKAFVSDEYNAFWLQIHNEVGSGFHFGKGAMFQMGIDRIKQMCIDYPDKAPAKIANMVPVFDSKVNEADSFSELYVWLLYNYGEKVHVLSGLHANIHSFGWTGSPIGLFRTYKNCFMKLKRTGNSTIDNWIDDNISELDAEISREQGQNDYMRMHYGHYVE